MTIDPYVELRDSIRRANEVTNQARKRVAAARDRVSALRRANVRLQHELAKYVGSHRASRIAKQILAEDSHGVTWSKNS